MFSDLSSRDLGLFLLVLSAAVSTGFWLVEENLERNEIILIIGKLEYSVKWLHLYHYFQYSK